MLATAASRADRIFAVSGRLESWFFSTTMTLSFTLLDRAGALDCVDVLAAGCDTAAPAPDESMSVVATVSRPAVTTGIVLLTGMLLLCRLVSARPPVR